MKTPFGPPIDSKKLYDYLETHSPQQMLTDTINWDCDPTDLLSIADIFNFRLDKPQYSIVLYKKALNLMNDNPNLVSSDTNVQGAYAAYGTTLIKLKMHNEALSPLLEAYRLNNNDYIVMLELAICYLSVNQLDNSKKYLNKIVNTEYGILKEWLTKDEINLSNNLYNNLLEDKMKIINCVQCGAQETDEGKYFECVVCYAKFCVNCGDNGKRCPKCQRGYLSLRRRMIDYKGD